MEDAKKKTIGITTIFSFLLLLAIILLYQKAIWQGLIIFIIDLIFLIYILNKADKQKQEKTIGVEQK